MKVVEDEAAGTFEVPGSGLVRRQVDDAQGPEYAHALQVADHVRTPFPATRGRVHRVQDDGAVGMERHPVAGEDGVRGGRLHGILENYDAYPGLLERRRKRIELLERPAVDPLRLSAFRRALEDVGRRRLDVEPEGFRAHHHRAPGLSGAVLCVCYHPRVMISRASAAALHKTRKMELNDSARALVEFDMASIRQVVAARRDPEPAVWILEPAGYQHDGHPLRDNDTVRLIGYVPASRAIYATDGCNSCRHAPDVRIETAAPEELARLSARTQLPESMLALLARRILELDA